MRFSQRYGYTHVSQAIVRETITEAIQNSICSACDILEDSFKTNPYHGFDKYMDLERFLWVNFCNQRLSDFSQDGRHYIVLTEIINDPQYPWHQKLDALEMAVKYLLTTFPEGYNFHKDVLNFIGYINQEFERHCYAYRIVGDSIVEITSKVECQSIQEALDKSPDIVARHLNNALTAYSKRPTGDYTNSIKESISAVEAICRQATGESTLGKALKSLEKKGVAISPVLQEAFVKIYSYTNLPDTGIRHALMDSTAKYVPGNNEARYMLIVCSAFVNYLHSLSNP